LKKKESYTGLWQLRKPIKGLGSEALGELCIYKNGAIVLSLYFQRSETEHIIAGDINYIEEINGSCDRRTIVLSGIHLVPDIGLAFGINSAVKIQFKVESCIIDDYSGAGKIDVFMGVAITSKLIKYWLPDQKINRIIQDTEETANIPHPVHKEYDIVDSNLKVSIQYGFSWGMKAFGAKNIVSKFASVYITSEEKHSSSYFTDIADKFVVLMQIFTGYKSVPTIRLIRSDETSGSRRYDEARFFRWDGKSEN
jgi:ApeA N-terminal domain 1